ncbi:MAG TPA: ATP synthase F1 subunit epsilon [Acidimicrobiales bacterium]|nr:ATP synthase F1 subunit epsilon [Acidimicrobiales bacterium]
MATLKVEIVTPEAPLWVGEATALVARSTEGWFTVLPEHMDMVGNVVPSVVRVGTTEGEIAIAVHGGFFQVGPGEAEGETLATVLAGIAEKVDEIDVARAQAAKESAEAEIAADSRNEQETTASALARAALERAELRLNAAKS